MEDDPFEPAAGPQPRPGDPGIAKQWGEFLSDPKGQAAMVQMGIALLQPVGVGQSELGHIGSAIGQGGEAVGRMEDRELKEKAIDIRGERTTQSLTNAAERLGIAQERLNLSRDRAAGTTGAQTVQRGRADAKRVEDLALKAQGDVLGPHFQKPIAEIMKDPAFLKDVAALTQGREGVSPSVVSGLPPKESLKAGQLYEVPGRGQMKWTGTGFVKP